MRGEHHPSERVAMGAIYRRSVLSLAVALAVPCRPEAKSPEALSTEADEGILSLARYATDHRGKRPSILVLHGTRGVDLNPQAYERYIYALTFAGIDAYLLRYFTIADFQALDPKTSTSESRSTYDSGRYGVWSNRVSAVVTAVLARPDSSGHIGLLGFSLGGYVAAATAAKDERISAVAVLYGGMPDAAIGHVKHLPPLIELHGEDDRSVPVMKGAELVALARSVGAPAEQVTYPNKGHGFDFADKDPVAADAVVRVVHFFSVQLEHPLSGNDASIAFCSRDDRFRARQDKEPCPDGPIEPASESAFSASTT